MDLFQPPTPEEVQQRAREHRPPMKGDISDLDEIVPLIRNGRVTLWIGSGLSNIAGCKLWNDVVIEMFGQPPMINKGLLYEALKDELLFPDMLRLCWKTFKEQHQESVFESILLRVCHYDATKFKQFYSPIIRAIDRLDPKISIVTTNIDNCLEDTFLFDDSVRFYLTSDFKSENIRPRSIFHIHGIMQDFKTGVWHYDNYQELYQKPGMQEFMNHIARERIVLFIGCALRDPMVIDFFKRNMVNTHYALFPEEEYNPSKQAYWKTHNINLVNYGKREDFAKEFISWIDQHFGKSIDFKEDIGGEDHV